MKSFALSCMLAAAAFAAPAEDLMKTLPDAPKFKSNTYSGYLATGTETKSLHYIFAESYNDPANAPLIIWFNGGPGCSSILAFMQENGPLKVDDGETFVTTNLYPWN